MEAFVESHLKLVELERTEEITNSQLLLSSSPKVLESKGLCLQRMRLANLRTGLYGRTIAEFEHHCGSPPRDLPANAFSSGDLVGIYSERAPFPGCGDDGGVITAVLLKLSPRAASLVLDDAASAERLADDGMFRLVKLGSDVTYKRIKKGLLTLQSKSRDSRAAHLVDVLFNESPPASTPPLPTPAFFNAGLDDSQREAVAFALARPDVAVIHGPPGTGKTTTVVELIRQAILPQHGHRRSRVLACAPSNVAVDNLVERLAAAQPQPRIVRLGHAARVMPHIQKYSLEARLTNSDGWQLVKDVQQEMDALRQRMAGKRTAGRDKKEGDKGASVKLRHEMTELRKELRQREAKALQEIYDRSEVVLATLTGLHEDKTLSKVEFDLVVIDECSQSVEAACWLALLRGPRCVLAGDHLQLPPTVVSKEACKGGLELSLMERVLRLYPGDRVTRMLTTQYRMHADIMGWSAEHFYEGRLEAHPSVAGHGLSDLPQVRAEDEEEELRAAVVLIDTAGCGVAETVVEQSRGNVGEAELVRFFVERRVSGFGLRPEDVGVITPYNLQVELIRNRLKPRFPGLEVRTVDGFQGREKEVIVLSLVRSNAQAEVGFLAEHRRLNVAVTRARRQLVVICDTDTLARSKDAVLGGFADYLRQRAGVVRTAQELIDSGDVDVGAVLDSDFVGLEGGDKAATGKKKTRNKKGKKEARGQERTPSGRPSLGKPQPKDGKTKREAKEEEMKEEEQFRQQLLSFKVSEETEKNFPDTLSGRQRAVIHELAESLDLVHISVGEGKDRHLIVKKSPALPTKDESKTLDSQGDAPCGRETSAAPNPPAAQGAAALDPPAAQGAAAPDPPAAQCAAAPEPRADSQENAIMRQLREYREREHLRRQQQLREEQQRKRESHRAAKAARSGAALAGVPDDDFDALIAAATALDAVCAQADCAVKVKTLGHHCPLCSRRYCSSHRLPESHGCGMAAREEARKVISREGRIYAGSGVPSKKIDPTKRAHLERKLDKRIDEMTTQRKSKEKKKK